MDNSVTPLVTTINGAGTSLSVVGDTYRLLLTGKQTDGAFAVIDMLIPPQGGPGPHAHPDMLESFYVAEGEVVFRTKGETITARKGDFINIPRGGVVHGFKNESDATAHLVCMVIPAGLDQMFEEVGKPVEFGAFLPPPDPDSEEMKQMQSTAEKYGQQVFSPDYFGSSSE